LLRDSTSDRHETEGPAVPRGGAAFGPRSAAAVETRSPGRRNAAAPVGDGMLSVTLFPVLAFGAYRAAAEPDACAESP